VSLRCREPRIVCELATDPFAALAHPIRRQIVERLSRGATTVGQASRDLGVSNATGHARRGVEVDRAPADPLGGPLLDAVGEDLQEPADRRRSSPRGDVARIDVSTA
jgi:hypothetical protein